MTGIEMGIYSFGDATPDPLTGRTIDVGQRVRDLVDEIVLADEVGLDVFGVGEHHRPDFPVSSPAVVLAAAAARTSRIRLTSSVTVLSSDDPVRVFQDFATLDLISAGRARLLRVGGPLPQRALRREQNGDDRAGALGREHAIDPQARLLVIPRRGSDVEEVIERRLEVVDADGLIEAQENQTLQQIMDGRGNAAFRAIEEQVLTDMPLFSSVISTGGSVVYSERIMSRLCAASTVVYLRATFETIEYRVSLAPQRGISSDSGQTLQDLYQERVPLYERYGEIVVDCDEAPPEEIALSIRAQLPTTRLN